MRFEFATATRIVFGAGALAELEGIARPLGTRALLVTGRATERVPAAREQLGRAGVSAVPFSIAHEPTVEDVRQGTALAREAGCELVVAVGGGSVIDAGKAVAGLLGNGGDPLDYLEVVGQGRPLTRAAAPWVAVPTTAGTGAEVTRNAVLGSPEHKVKASLRSSHLLAQAAVVDPDLLLGLPPPVIAAGGLDALTQLVEPFVSARANPMVDGLCREGLKRSARSLKRFFEGDGAADVRQDLALASLFGGLALANAGLGAVHGLAAPIGGMFAAPHGAVCAALLAGVMEANVRALAARAPRSPALARYSEVAAIVTGNAGAAAEDGVAWVRALARSLSVSGLSRSGVTAGDVAALVGAARRASSMRANPIELNEGELAEIVRAAL